MTSKPRNPFAHGYASSPNQQPRGYNIRQALPFPVVAAMLRLGKKYEFDHLRDEALLRLTSEFPTKLEEWDALPDHFTHIIDRKGLLFDIIRLAIECGVQSILPAAYFLAVPDVVGRPRCPEVFDYINFLAVPSVIWPGAR
jgi:hypothetical protein